VALLYSDGTANLRHVSWLDRIGYEAARLGDRVGLDVLRYNPTVFQMYDRLANNDAPAVMRALQSTFPDARSLVDVGAGTGAYAAAGGRLGLQVVAFERSRIGRRMGIAAGVDIRPFDLRGELHPPTSDLAYSFEVAEHVPVSLAPRFVRFLAGCARMSLMTAAPPGQGGVGHVNEQPSEYWIDAFREIGYNHDRVNEKEFVSQLPLDTLSALWRSTNILAFSRRG
jgi:hypothetical protein